MTTPQSGTSLAAYCIQLINKYDARCMFFGLDKEISHPGGTYAYKHFYKIRPTDAEKWHLSLSCYGPGQEGLACARLPYQQYTLWNSAPKAGKFFWVLQKCDYFFQFFLGLFYSCYIIKCDFCLLISDELGLTAAKG